MDNQDFQDLKKGHKYLFAPFLVVLNIFLIVLVVSGVVGIQNKIKEGKYIGQGVATKNTITVSDTGEVYVKPDLALTTFSVVTEEKTVDLALSKNTEKMNKVISLTKDQGVEDRDLKTTSLNIYPCYEWREEKTGIPPYPQGRRVLVGYEVRQSLEVKIRDMEKIGQIIEGAADAGANQIGNLRFTVDKQDEFKRQARNQAIEKAKVKAKELASQLGVNLVRITNFSESGTVPRYYAMEKAIGAMEVEEEALQIETGENKIEATVSITYEIN